MIDFSVGFFFGMALMAVLSSFYNRIIIVEEIKKVKDEFTKIHTRLISVIAEWQKKV